MGKKKGWGGGREGREEEIYKGVHAKRKRLSIMVVHKGCPKWGIRLQTGELNPSIVRHGERSLRLSMVRDTKAVHGERRKGCPW